MKRMITTWSSLPLLIAGGLPMRAQDTLESQLNARLERVRSLASIEVKPTEFVKGNVTYSGIAVAWFRADKWPEPFNPLAPAKYGSGEDNVLREPSTNRVYGWKLFSIRF